MATLAQEDASWASTACSTGGEDFLTVLNFGRPGLHNGAYSVLDHNNTWVSYNWVATYAEQYASDWYTDSSSCPHLVLVIGTANSYECYNGDNGCSVYTAGVQFDQLVHTVITHASSQPYNWQETFWGGDDVEAEWDQYAGSSCAANPKTEDFLNGYNNEETTYVMSHTYLADYGDADYGVTQNYQTCPGVNNLWSENDIYQASWGIGWDVPLPEVYTSYQLSNWVNVYHAYHTSNGFAFYALMTECSQADSLPYGNCYDQRNNQCELSPQEAYNDSTAYNDPTGYSGATNIQWQNDAHSSNNNC